MSKSVPTTARHCRGVIGPVVAEAHAPFRTSFQFEKFVADSVVGWATGNAKNPSGRPTLHKSVCNFNKSPATCDQPAQLNQPCNNGAICDVTLWCDTTQTSPVCKSKLADGTACTSDVQCFSSDCNAATPRVCNPTPPSAVLCVGR